MLIKDKNPGLPLHQRMYTRLLRSSSLIDGFCPATTVLLGLGESFKEGRRIEEGNSSASSKEEKPSQAKRGRKQEAVGEGKHVCSLGDGVCMRQARTSNPLHGRCVVCFCRLLFLLLGVIIWLASSIKNPSSFCFCFFFFFLINYF